MGLLKPILVSFKSYLWSFTNAFSRSSDPVPHCPNKNTCAENAHTALLEYIHRGKDIGEKESPAEEHELSDKSDRHTHTIEHQRLNTVHDIDHGDGDRRLHKIKHQRLNTLHDIDHGDRHPHRIKRQRLNTLHDNNNTNTNTNTNTNDDDDDDDDDGTDDIDDVDDTNRGTNYLTHQSDATADGEQGVIEGEGDATESDGGAIEHNAEAVLKIIRKGLSIVLSAEREGKSSQLQAKHTSMVVTKDQHLSTDIIPSQFVAQDGDTPGSRSLRLEHLLWQQSKTVLRSAKKIAWKSSFLAACLRRIRDPTDSTEHKSTYRWRTAVWMINSIVDELWPSWGPKAALIYEALAGMFSYLLFDTVFDMLPVKNYNLSRIVQLSKSTRSNIITRITNSLRDSIPDIALEVDVFHPAAFISTALAMEYVISPYRDRLQQH
jgi:hypothetical protein